MRRSILLLPVLLALAGAARGQETPAAVDVVFVVDASNSMSKNDPEGLRNTFMKMTVDFMSGRGGDRIGVVQFGGWHETQTRNVVVFPLTQIPEPGKGAEFQKKFGDAVGKAEIFGSASDINVAFELGLGEIQKQRGATKNGYWVIVLTDAALSAPEPAKVREEYKKKAAAMFKLGPEEEANDDQLNAAALEIFKTDVAPKFSGAGLKISAVTLAKKAPPADSPIQALVGKGNKVGVLTKSPLKDLVIPMLAGSQLYPKGTGGFYGYAAGKASYAVHLHEGSQGTRALVWSRGAQVKATVKGPDPSKCEVVGGGPYQVVHFRGAPAGDYTIEIQADGGEGIEAVTYADLPYAAEVKLVTPEEIAAGDDIKIDIAVTRDGKPVKDPGFLKDLKAKVRIKSAAGDTVKEVEFKGESKAQFATATDSSTPAGPIELTVEITGVPDGTVAPHSFTVTPKVFKVTTSTVVEATFEKAEVSVDEPAVFTVKGAKGVPPKELLSDLGIRKGSKDERFKLSWDKDGWRGTVPSDAIAEFEIAGEKKAGVIVKAGRTPKLRVVGRSFTAQFSTKEVFERQPVQLVVKADGAKAELVRDLLKEFKVGGSAVKLTWRGDQWTGDVDTSKAGDYEIATHNGGKFEVKPGAVAKLTVKARKFVVLDKDGKEVSQLKYDVRYIEKATYEQELTVRLDVGEGETGSISAMGKSDAKDVAIGIGDQKTVTVTPATTTQKVRAVLAVNTDAVIPEQVGSLMFTAKIAGIGDLEWTKEVKVEVVFTDKGMKLFLKYLPFILGGLLLLAIILFFVLRASWREQQLRAFLNNNLDTKYLMSTMGGGRSATGTAESPGSTGFALSGMKFTENAVTMSQAKADVHVFHMDKPVAGPTKLKHGDVIAVEVGAKKQYYVYFEKEPTPEELKKALDGLIESDEIFIEE